MVRTAEKDKQNEKKIYFHGGNGIVVSGFGDHDTLEWPRCCGLRWSLLRVRQLDIDKHSGG
jgi:hypothetical protein